MMMIAFITIKSSLVPLIEGLCVYICSYTFVYMCINMIIHTCIYINIYIHIYIYSYEYICLYCDTNHLFTKTPNWPWLFLPSYLSYRVASRQHFVARL